MDPSRARVFERSDRELEAGRIWRAREILEGSLPTFGYDPELYERLGRVLLRMGDLPGAGRFLFLSGARADEYREAIDLFRRRHSKAILAAFPRAARGCPRSRLPPAVADELRELGVPERPEPATPFFGPTRWRDRLVAVGCAGSVLTVGAVLVAGVIKIAEILGSLG